MSERFREFDNPEEIFTTLESLEAPNQIANDHKEAIALQKLYDEFEGTEEERNEFLQQGITILDQRCSHIEKMVKVSGKVMLHELDYLNINYAEEFVDTPNPRLSSKIFEEYTAQSMGYAALKNPENENRYIIYHVAVSPFEPIADITNIGTILRNKHMFIPVDGSTMVEFTEETTEPHTELLRYYIGDLLDKIDYATLNQDSMTGLIQQLSEINLDQWKNQLTDVDTAIELIKYLNKALGFKNAIPHQISGMDEIMIITEGAETRCKVPPEARITCHVNGFSIIDENGESPQLSLSMNMPFSDNTVRDVTIPLSPILQLEEHDSFNIVQP